MNVKEDLLRIQSTPYDENGNRLEPEEMPAERVLVVDAPAVGNLDGRYLGQMRASVNIQRPVHEFANGLRTMCAACKHFDNRTWVRIKSRLEGTKEGVQLVNAVRGELMRQGLGPASMQMHEGADGALDVEHAVAVMGICRALTEQKREEVLVHPMGGCPQEICTELSPQGFFEDFSPTTELMGAQAFDRLMRKAEGKE